MRNTIFYTRTSFFFSALLALCMCIAFPACDDDDEAIDIIALHSFGPSPVLRGGELRFIGNGLDKVTAIVLSNNVEVTSFTSKSSTLIELVVPEATVSGYVTLKTPEGDITTKTILTISEPIAITSFSPARVRPGDVLTINGTYLNLAERVIFTMNKAVNSDVFITHEQGKIEVTVPADAQTGAIIVSNGAQDPILVTSENPLEVAVPHVTGASPNPVKAGSTLTLTGTDLDLTKTVTFGGGAKVESFTSASQTELVLQVPANAQDGKLRLSVASLVETESEPAIVMVVPSIQNVSPNPAKNGQEVTVTGQDLDLVTSVTFGGGKQGTVTNASTTELTITVPIDATEDVVAFATQANKSVSSASVLNLVSPSITGMNPGEVKTNNPVTFTGTNLDLVNTVLFTGVTGDLDVSVTGGSETEFTVVVPSGTVTSTVRAVAFNGTTISTVQELTILPSNVPVITSMPASAKPGNKIGIEGTNMSVVTEVIFPGNVSATMYGVKTDELIEVFVPLNVEKGVGTLTLVTFEGEMAVSPEINIQGVDAIADPTLVFFNFDGVGLDSWWGDSGAPENDPALSLDGTNYFRVNADRNGWTGLFWRNGKNNFPADVIGTAVADYVLKVDINILEPMTAGQLRFRFKGAEGDFWYLWAPWESQGPYMTDGWITITIPVSAFRDNYGWGTNGITDMSLVNEDFGLAFDGGASKVNACFDNMRFERIE